MQMTFWNDNEKQNKEENSFSAENEKKLKMTK